MNPDRRIYTVPTSPRWRCSQIEGMALFTAALVQAQKVLKARGKA